LLVVGSSNPARDIALASRYRPDISLLRNRGAAGIDGTVSTAIGAALGHGRPAYALLGDLTFLHDINGLLIGPDERKPDLCLVVINDDGGGIFSLLEQGEPRYGSSFDRLFGTPHHADLSRLCAGYGVPHTKVRSSKEFRDAVQQGNGIRVLEIQCDRSLLRRYHQELRERSSKAINRA